MNRLFYVLFFCFLAGCSTPASRAVNGYSSQQNCLDRAQYTVDGEADKPRIQALYNQKSCTLDGDTDTKECDHTPLGHYCVATKGSKSLCLKHTAANEFRIDFGCTVGWNEPSMALLKTTRVARTTFVRTKAQLSTTYTSDFEEKDWVAVHLIDPNHNSAHYAFGYVARNAPLAQEMLNLLQDGQEHPITVVLAHPPHTKSLSEFEVIHLVHTGWQPPDEKETTDADNLYAGYMHYALRRAP